jgi:hypothetical protein
MSKKMKRDIDGYLLDGPPIVSPGGCEKERHLPTPVLFSWYSQERKPI